MVSDKMLQKFLSYLKTVSKVTLKTELQKYIKESAYNTVEAFTTKTGLDEKIYRMIMSKKGKYTPSLQTIITICVALNLNKDQCYDLVRLAKRARSFNPDNNRIHRTYMFFVEDQDITDITDCNIFLVERNCEEKDLLGSCTKAEIEKLIK